MTRANPLVLVLGVLLSVHVLGQGLYMEGKEAPTDADIETGKLTRTYAMPGKFRHEQASGSVTIVRVDKEVMYVLMPKDKTYLEMTFAQLEETMKSMKSMGDMLGSKREEIRKKLDELPEDQRKMVEKAMGKSLDASPPEPKVEVKATGEKKDICGYGCRKHVATEDGVEFLTAWTTKDVREMEAMRKDWEAVTQRLMAATPGQGTRMGQAYRKLGTFPLEIETGGRHTLVTKIESKEIDAELFEVPADYTKTTSPPGMGVAAPKKAQAAAAKRADLENVGKDAPAAKDAPASKKAAAKFCTDCGKKIAAGAKFCTECGAKVE